MFSRQFVSKNPLIGTFQLSYVLSLNLGRSQNVVIGNGLEQCMVSLNFTYSWLVVLGFNATLTAKVISWRSVTHVFPGFLTPGVTQLFFPKPPTTFLTCFYRGERQNKRKEKSSTGNQTKNLQVMSPTRSPLSHPGRANFTDRRVRLFGCYPTKNPVA